jgi:hypothetical protein
MRPQTIGGDRTPGRTEQIREIIGRRAGSQWLDTGYVGNRTPARLRGWIPSLHKDLPSVIREVRRRLRSTKRKEARPRCARPTGWAKSQRLVPAIDLSQSIETPQQRQFRASESGSRKTSAKRIQHAAVEFHVTAVIARSRQCQTHAEPVQKPGLAVRRTPKPKSPEALQAEPQRRATQGAAAAEGLTSRRQQVSKAWITHTNSASASERSRLPPAAVSRRTARSRKGASTAPS